MLEAKATRQVPASELRRKLSIVINHLKEAGWKNDLLILIDILLKLDNPDWIDWDN